LAGEYKALGYNIGSLGSLALLNQGSLKNRPRIKTGMIGPPKAPAVSIFLDWQANQYMDSAFLVFDLGKKERRS
jgi:hypothetical protein